MTTISAEAQARPEYVITGCARSGTTWALKVLRAAGIETTQETVFGVHGPRWYHTKKAEVSWLAAPYLAELPETKIIHLVRHPLPTITSLAFHALWKEGRGLHPFTLYAKKHLQLEGASPDPIAMAALYWVQWNKLIESLAPQAKRVCVEDGPKKLLGAMGITTTVPNPGNRINTRAQEPPLSWRRLPSPWREKVEAMAARYSYLPFF